MDSTALVSVDEVVCLVLNLPFSDINECDSNEFYCLSNSECMNIEGNYTCPCINGFAGDGFTGCESKLCYLSLNYKMIHSTQH